MQELFRIPEEVSIRYIVNDISTCVRFYSELLGFEIRMNPPGFAMLSRGNMRLLLNEPGAGGAGQPMPDGSIPSPGGWNRMQLQTRDIHAAIDFLKNRNVTFRGELIAGNGGK